MKNGLPERIVCLTEESTEWLYLLGEEARIVGISAYTCRPARAKQEKPVVSAYIGGHIQKIKALQPELVIGFSDVQAQLAHDLIKANLQVLITNQRSVQEILDVLLMLGRMVGAEEKAHALVKGYRRRLQAVREASLGQRRPRVYFEEWDEPMISAIQWVSELIELAGGDPIFHDRASGKASKARTASVEEVIHRAPEVYIGCWCGKPLDKESVRTRPGFEQVPAIQRDRLYEMDPAIILQPGPACLTDGLDELVRIISENQ